MNLTRQQQQTVDAPLENILTMYETAYKECLYGA